MSTTVFCTFEQQDMADLAVGKLRDTVAGIRSVQYISGFNENQTILNRKSLELEHAHPVSSLNGVLPSSRPVMVKIVCADSAAAKVKARLINLRAYQIITTR